MKDIKRKLKSIAMALLAMMLLLPMAATAQTDPYEGTWYITNGSSFYLCPAAGYYQDNVDTPYITTYKTGKDHSSIWTIVKVEVGVETYYRIIHNATGKYVTAHDAVDGFDPAYLRMHLESFDTPTDATLFIIVTHNNKKAIRSKDFDDAANNNYWSIISIKNQNNLWNFDHQGALGFGYNNPIDNNSAAPWTFETATPICATPVIIYSESGNTFSISYPGDNTGVSIHYTTDGTPPTASSTVYNGAIAGATVTAKLRAIAVKTGYTNSDEAVVYGTDYSAVPHLFKTIDAANQSYYLISPVDDDDNTESRNFLTTSNVPNPRMQWLIKPATASNGVQYHYLVNSVTGKYVYFTGTGLEQGSKFLVKDRNEAGTEDDRFMFRIWEGDGYFNISPKILSGFPPSHNKGNMLAKQSATDHVNPIGVYRDDNTQGRARWQLVNVPADPRSLSALPAEMVSTADNAVYFKLRNAAKTNNNDYFVYPPSSAAYATAATSGTNPEWYLLQASDADTWNTYYYIRNAQTGCYLYFDGTAYNDNGNKFFTSDEVTEGNEDKYKFLVLKTANTTYSGTYHIVPKSIRNNNNQANIALNRDGSALKTRQSRNSGNNSGNSCWYLDEVGFKCDVPSFNYSSGQLSITCATQGATIYYASGSSAPAISPANQYTGPITLSSSPATVTAIAVRNSDGSDQSDPVTFTVAIISSGDDITSMSGYYVLASNFTPPSSPIGTVEHPFSGTFDGSYVPFSLNHPLFGVVDGATIKNVRISTATVSGTGHKGALVNDATGASHIYNCGVLAGSVTSSDAAAGGLVGHIAAGSNVRVVNCYNYATISGSTYAAGIVGWNEGTVDGSTTVNGTGVRIANCMMYGDITSGTVKSPVYCGNHTNNQQKLTEYNFWRSRANLAYTAYNDQLAIGKDENLERFPFYRHILNTHREMAAYFLFADHTDEHVSEIGHWVLNTDIAPYPIVEPWATNTTKVLSRTVPSTNADYAGKKLTTMGASGDLAVTVIIGNKTYNANLPITDMDTLRYDFTWGKVVLPYANEFSGWTRDYDYVCTGWKITSVTKGSSTLNTFSIPSSEPYNFADRNNAQKDIYNATSNPYVFAQGGNYIVPYGVTAITIEAHFARAYYLSDPSADVGYKTDYSGPTNLGWSVPNTFHGKTVYTSLNTLVGQLSNASNPNDQAIVLVGNFHYRVTGTGDIYLNTAKAVTIMSCDEDNNQEPDYAWYMGNTYGRLPLPPLRFDLPIIEIGMAARVNGSKPYPGVGIWHTRGWFELTENCVNNSSQFEINSSAFTSSDNGCGNNRWIANSGRFIQIVRAREANCTKLSYIQIGGNAYVQEVFPGSHTDNARTTATVPILVTGGEVLECYMSGYKAGATLSGNMIYFWGAGGRIKKWLGSYLENPSAAGVTAKIDHARIYRFFGGGTSAAARVKGNIDITINNSFVNFYCGGPEFGDMYEGKSLTTHATGTTFKVYYGAGFGGTSITYDRKAQTAQLDIGDNTTTYDLAFTNYTNYRLKVDDNFGIGTCYKFEFIFNSNANKLVSRFYTGYAQFSLAETRNVTNVLENCTILTDFYGAGCQGRVNGTVTSTLTNCTVNGNAYGGGYKATANEVSVYTTTKPTYSVFTRETGLFSDFGTVAPETYTWIQGSAAGSSQTDKTLTTTTNMSTLGNVTGDISLTIVNGTVAGDVYGGGNESPSNSNTSVLLRGNANILGNVYGGGNKADVGGNSSVTIQDPSNP